MISDNSTIQPSRQTAFEDVAFGAVEMKAAPRSATDRPVSTRVDPRDGLTERVRQLCNGNSAAQIGAMTSTHPETARRYLAGITTPSAQFLAALCGALGVSGHWLLTGDGSLCAPDGDVALNESVARELKNLRGHLRTLERELLRLETRIGMSPG